MIQTTRRHFMEGAAGLAGLLGLGSIREVTAQEVTAAATAVDDYVWTPPQWDPEPTLLTVIERNESAVSVETVDGIIEIPANPNRIVTLAWEYIPLFDLDIIQKVVGVAYGEQYGHQFWNAGNRTVDMHTALENVARIPDPWELDIEEVVVLEPDLILTATGWPENHSALTQIATTIRTPTLVSSAPRAAIRDYGTLFDRTEIAEEVIADHDAFIKRAQEAITPTVGNKKAVTLIVSGGELLGAIPSHYVENDQVFAYADGAYQLHRELDIPPSSFVEKLADEDNRESLVVGISLEHIGDIDADYFFLFDYDRSFDTFVNNPVVQQTVAARNNHIFLYDGMTYGLGLGGVQAAVTSIVESITGEPFE